MLHLPKKQLLGLLPLVIATILSLSFAPAIASTMPLTQAEIDRELQTVPQWQQSQQTIVRTFEFKNFVEAIAFVDKLVEPAEAMGHHPDLSVSYNKVTVSLTSHDAGGLTDKDFKLAQTISNLAL